MQYAYIFTDNDIRQFFLDFTPKFNQSFCHNEVVVSAFSCYFIILRKFGGLTILKRILAIL